MRARHTRWATLLLLLAACATPLPQDRAAAVHELLRRADLRGLAVARIEGGEVVQLITAGRRNGESGQAGAPLEADTVMYAASLTKTLFALVVLQLADEGRLQLDTPLAALLPQPLSAYPEFAEQGADPRWRQLTPRLLLSHQGGLANWRWLDDDQRLKFHHDPGRAYHYSGEGYQLLQLALEAGLGLDLEAEVRRRVFEPLGMTRSSLRWNPAFADNAADGYDAQGRRRPHARRGRVRLAGSLDSSPADQARWCAAGA